VQQILFGRRSKQHLPREYFSFSDSLLVFLLHFSYLLFFFQKLGQQKLSEKQFGAALHWYGLSKNRRQVSQALKRIQEEYIHQEAPEDLGYVIENIDAGVFASNYFSFLAKLSKVQQEIKSGSAYSSLEDRQSHFEGAAKLIVDMIASRYAPRDYWFLLLKKIETFILSKSLLSCIFPLSSPPSSSFPSSCAEERVILSKETSQILLAALEELEVPKWTTDPYANEPTYEDDEEDLGGEETMETEEGASHTITTISPSPKEVQQLRELLVRSVCTAIAY
jgi:hypothetical protein